MSSDNWMYRSFVAQHGVDTADYVSKEFGWAVDRLAIVRELEELAAEIRKSAEFNATASMLTTKEPE